MTYQSYRDRIGANGGSITNSTKLTTKRSQKNEIASSPLRADVYLNLDSSIKYMCIPRDINTYEIRKFLFEPDTPIYKGDYIQYDSFTYLVTEANTSDTHPLANGLICNYDFPVKTEDIETDEVAGKKPNGKPIYKTQKLTHTIPCAVTSKIYSQVDNSILPLPDGALTVYLPYRPTEPMPERDQEVVVHDAQYYVADILRTNILKFDGIEKGYLELRLQRMQKDVSTKS